MRCVLLAVALLACFTARAGADDAQRAVDVAHSKATFSVTHVYVTRVSGSVPILSGSVSLAPNSDVPTAVSAVLDARHVATDDADRDDDLQGPDWFDTKRFPTWTFASSSVVPGADESFAVAGSLTVHGVAQPVTLAVTVTRGLPHPAYHAVAHVDRHAFGMRVTPMDGLIGNDVTLDLVVQVR